MSLSSVAIKRPVFAWMIMAFLIIFGGISAMRMGISQLPDVDFPVLTVSVNMLGAAPEVMETDIVDVIEDAVMAVEGVTKVTSSSQIGSASITIQLDLGRNVDVALQDVQAKIASIQKKLPREMDPATITKSNPDDQPIMWVTLNSDHHTLRQLMDYNRDHLAQYFSTTPDVGEVFMGGFINPNLRVWVDSNKMDQFELTVTDIINTITREHSEPPAGWIDDGKREFNVRTMGEAKSTEEFGRMVINTRGGTPNYTPILLHQIAKVEEGLADVRRVARTEGHQSVGLGIKKQRGANAVGVAKQVRKTIDRLIPTLPQGMKLNVVFDSTKYIEDAVGEMTFTLLLSALLTSLVCWLFLGSWSSTFNVLLAIPTSIIGTFIILYFSGFTLNTFTLLGLSLAIGIVVDDAIMVLENIIRHREGGASKVRSALVGSREITFAAIAATVSIVAIFLPVAFMQGIVGRFFFQFGVTMTAAVLLSLLEALTLTPMRCAAFVDAGHRTTRMGRMIDFVLEGITHGYRALLQGVLRWRWLVLIGSLIFFAASMLAVKYLPKEFIPPEDQSRFVIRVQTPIGSALTYTDKKMREMEKFLDTRQEIEKYFLNVGGFNGQVNGGNIFITMKPKGKRGVAPEIGHEPSQQDFMNICREKFKQIEDLKATMMDLSMRGFTASKGFPIEFVLQGPDWDKLGQYSQKLMANLEKTGMVTDMDSDYQMGMPELQIIPDRIKSAAHGVSVGDIGSTINALIGGVLVGRYPTGGHRDDILLKLMDDSRGRLEKINSLQLRNNRGELVPLRDVVTVQERPSLLSVARLNRERSVTLFGNLAKGQSQQAVLEKIVEMSKKELPEGYVAVLSGSSTDFKQTFQSLIIALVLGLVVAYMVLASQFNSFIDPITVFAALPFSLSGAFMALLWGHQSLNMYSMIGLILLMGIVKKNSILLVDFTNQVRDTDPTKSIREALLIACPIRLRPILMTSVATIAGAVPPALALGPGAESRVPMAVAVIGGVIVATILTLFVVPCVYSFLSPNVRRKIEAEEAVDHLELAVTATTR